MPANKLNVDDRLALDGETWVVTKRRDHAVRLAHWKNGETRELLMHDAQQCVPLAPGTHSTPLAHLLENLEKLDGALATEYDDLEDAICAQDVDAMKDAVSRIEMTTRAIEQIKAMPVVMKTIKP